MTVTRDAGDSDGAVDAVLVIAKRPVAGRVKTRLIGELDAHQAASLAAAALSDTLAAIENVPCRHRILLFDGDPSGWLPLGWRHERQVAGGLDERLVAGFEAAGDGPALLVGMDTPQLDVTQLAFDPSRYDAALGMATDGGYWVIGLREPARAASVIRGVPMSTGHTGAAQLQRMLSAGMAVQILPELSDVDTPDVAAGVAATHPHTGFARRWREFTGVGA
jgi:hypothetical protein